jgi:hypothetical protein
MSILLILANHVLDSEGNKKKRMIKLSDELTKKIFDKKELKLEDFFSIFKNFDSRFTDEELNEIKFLSQGRVFKKETILNLDKSNIEKLTLFIYCNGSKFKNILDKFINVFNLNGELYEGNMNSNNNCTFKNEPNKKNNIKLDKDIEELDKKKLQEEKIEAHKEACEEFMETTSDPKFTLMCNIILNSPETLTKVQQYFSHGNIEYVNDEKLMDIDNESFLYGEELNYLKSILENYNIIVNDKFIKYQLIKESGCLPLVLRIIFHNYLQENCVTNKS